MKSFETVRWLRNGNKLDTASRVKNKENDNTQNIMNALEGNIEYEHELLVLTREEVKEQKKGPHLPTEQTTIVESLIQRRTIT